MRHRLKRRNDRVRYRIVENTLVLDLGSVHRVLSSAPRGGGFVRARSIVNHQVPANPLLGNEPASGLRAQRASWEDPSRYLGRVATALKAAAPSVGLMTAVPMNQLVTAGEECKGVWVECFCTVGVTNAVRAGEAPLHLGSRRDRRKPGTINIILVTNATLAAPAMVGAVQVATESKTATLAANRVRSASGQRGATGTGTDAVVIASSRRGAVKLAYSGTHTVIGSMIGRLVARCVQEGLLRSARWHAVRLNRTTGVRRRRLQETTCTLPA